MRMKYTIGLVLALLFFSCEEDVVLDLGAIEKRLVVEAKITNQSHMGRVMLSYSQGFYDLPDSNIISYARVEMVENSSGTSEKLAFKDKAFRTKDLEPVEGEDYTLKVKVDDYDFEVNAYLPPVVEIASVDFVPNPFYGTPDSLNVFVNVQDPVGVDNFFRLFVYGPGEVDNETFYVQDDTFGKDGLITMPVYFRTYTWGDTVIVELRHLNKETYTYYSGLTDNIGGSFNSIAPGNPVSNMPDDVFGFFAGYSVDIDTLIVGADLGLPPGF